MKFLKQIAATLAAVALTVSMATAQVRPLPGPLDAQEGPGVMLGVEPGVVLLPQMDGTVIVIPTDTVAVPVEDRPACQADAPPVDALGPEFTIFSQDKLDAFAKGATEGAGVVEKPAWVGYVAISGDNMIAEIAEVLIYDTDGCFVGSVYWSHAAVMAGLAGVEAAAAAGTTDAK